MPAEKRHDNIFTLKALPKSILLSSLSFIKAPFQKTAMKKEDSE